ncbi:MAG: NADP-dependent oxidoreductase, partial [Shewanella sp.]
MNNMTETREIHLASRPEGMPTSQNFTLVNKTLAPLEDGQVLIKNLWMSVDPYMRGRMVDRKSYVPPFALNQALEGGAIGEVIASKNSEFPVGTQVSSMLGWREHAVTDTAGLTALPPTKLDRSHFLGVLGMPGMTAWTGLTRITDLKAGETLFVS